MKYLMAIIMVLIPVVCFSAPYLVCDPFPSEVGVTRFEITLDSTPTISVVPVNNALRQDMSSVATGLHTVRVRACNIWGCGEESSLNFTKSTPVEPTSISIVSQ